MLPRIPHNFWMANNVQPSFWGSLPCGQICVYMIQNCTLGESDETVPCLLDRGRLVPLQENIHLLNPNSHFAVMTSEDTSMYYGSWQTWVDEFNNRRNQ